MSYCLFEGGEFGIEGDMIVRIAWEAANKRMAAASERGSQLSFEGAIQEEGYVTYNDYDQYMEDRKRSELLKLANWDIARVRYEIRDTLLSRGWRPSILHPETRFYAPTPR